jgi:hypothetical protein
MVGTELIFRTAVPAPTIDSAPKSLTFLRRQSRHLEQGSLPSTRMLSLKSPDELPSSAFTDLYRSRRLFFLLETLGFSEWFKIGAVRHLRQPRAIDGFAGPSRTIATVRGNRVQR